MHNNILHYRRFDSTLHNQITLRVHYQVGLTKSIYLYVHIDVSTIVGFIVEYKQQKEKKQGLYGFEVKYVDYYAVECCVLLEIITFD